MPKHDDIIAAINSPEFRFVEEYMRQELELLKRKPDPLWNKVADMIIESMLEAGNPFPRDPKRNLTP